MNPRIAWALLAADLPAATFDQLLAGIDLDRLAGVVHVGRKSYDTTARRTVSPAAWQALLRHATVGQVAKLHLRVRVEGGLLELALLRDDRAGVHTLPAPSGPLLAAAMRAQLDDQVPTFDRFLARLDGCDDETRERILRAADSDEVLAAYMDAVDAGRDDVTGPVAGWLKPLLEGPSLHDDATLQVWGRALDRALDDLDAGVDTPLASLAVDLASRWASLQDAACDRADDDGDVTAWQAALPDTDRLAARVVTHAWWFTSGRRYINHPSGLARVHHDRAVDAIADGTSRLPADLQADVAAREFPHRARAWAEAGASPDDRPRLLGLLARVPAGQAASDGWPEPVRDWQLAPARTDGLRALAHVGSLLVQAGIHPTNPVVAAACDRQADAASSGALSADDARSRLDAVAALRDIARQVGALDEVDRRLADIRDLLTVIVDADPLAGELDRALQAGRAGDAAPLQAVAARAPRHVTAAVRALDEGRRTDLLAGLCRDADADQVAFALGLSRPGAAWHRDHHGCDAAVAVVRAGIAEARSGDPRLLRSVVTATSAHLPTTLSATEMAAVVTAAPAGGLAWLARCDRAVRDTVVTQVGDRIEDLAQHDPDVAAAALACRVDRWGDLALLLDPVDLGLVTGPRGMALIAPVVLEAGGPAAVQTLAVLAEQWQGTWAQLRDAALRLAGADDDALRAAAAESALGAAA